MNRSDDPQERERIAEWLGVDPIVLDNLVLFHEIYGQTLIREVGGQRALDVAMQLAVCVARSEGIDPGQFEATLAMVSAFYDRDWGC